MGKYAEEGQEGNKYHRMGGNAIRIPRETGSRSVAMESHHSQPSRRRHLMMMILQRKIGVN